MLLEFSVSNYRSIKALQTISFVATNSVSKYKEVDESNVFQATPKVRLLKTMAIYGANASGKSNFVQAIHAFRAIIFNSVAEQKMLPRFIEPFQLSTETEHQPTYFQIVMKIDETIYRYGFEANQTEIVSEWLFGTPNEREVYYFKRDYQKLDINKKQFAEASKLQGLLEGKNPIFRPDALLVSTLATFNNRLCLKIRDFMMNMNGISGLANVIVRNFADDLLEVSNEYLQKALHLLQSADIGITNMVIKSNEDTIHKQESLVRKPNKRVTTFHQKFDNQLNVIDKNISFDLDTNESEGTRRIYELAPFIFLTLELGLPLIIDEFDARLHPKLSKQIIEIFNNPATNPKNAQLLVVTHDTNLLSSQLFRRDQILFVEKNKYGASLLYALAAFKGVRNDASFENDYLMGRYGAVPYLNQLISIFES